MCKWWRLDKRFLHCPTMVKFKILIDLRNCADSCWLLSESQHRSIFKSQTRVTKSVEISKTQAHCLKVTTVVFPIMEEVTQIHSVRLCETECETVSCFGRSFTDSLRQDGSGSAILFCFQLCRKSPWFKFALENTDLNHLLLPVITYRP